MTRPGREAGQAGRLDGQVKRMRRLAQALVGLAISSGGHWLYATSEIERGTRFKGAILSASLPPPTAR